MFGKRAKLGPSPLTLDQESFSTLIGRQTVVEGQLRVRESVRIDGELIGLVHAPADQAVAVVVSPTGHVEGDIIARRVVIAGRVSGHIHAQDRVELHAGCLVQGDIKYGSIAIEHGARVLGLLLQVDDAQERIEHDTQAALARVQSGSHSTG
ncbi:MAG: polymer-forming cytoskeletal protein [Betaproteobacteria bacterium]|nr:polymer-forming cytoskeletal protein [Betaproteobacteria bacterium]